MCIFTIEKLTAENAEMKKKEKKFAN